MCERCGEPLPEGARFCPSCGFPVGAPAPSERKVVTVVFVDLVGSAKLSASIDPEAYREVIAAYYQTVTEELESLRGRAENFAGDAVVGVFGIPHAHDDDALRAVRAGLSIIERMGEIGESRGLPVPLRCRVGINTGPVAIGSEAAERGLLFGAVVNMAARLQQSAEPGEVLVGETSWLLTKREVGFGPERDITAKGFEDAIGWPVVALATRSSRRTIPFVNRRRELRLLADTFEGVRETSRGHLVTLFGEAGVGKSRVAEEFLAGLPEDTKVLVGRASPFEEDVTFAPLAQMLLHEMGEGSGAPAEDLLASLEKMVVSCCSPDETQQVIARLGIALGLGEGPRDERRYRVAEVRSGLLSFLTGIASGGPVVLVFEDVHLGQPSLLELIEQVVRDAKKVPLLVLCVARYDLLDDRPDWGGGLGDSLNLYLEPMSVEHATELAREAGERLDRATAERIARHAGGNPFFIVETTGMLLHEEADALGHDTGPLPSQLLPPTVQAVIAARIDHLSGNARDVVRKASVFARSTFDVTELGLIADPNEEVLAVLEDEELLLRDEERPGVWRFRHGIVRDVAYDSLPKRERQRLHLLVANELVEDADVASRNPRRIAYHLEQAARASLDLNPSDRSTAVRAVESLSHAGDLALAASEARSAADLYARALSLSGPERTWELSEAIILSNLGESRYWLGEFGSAIAPLQRALELGGEDTRVRSHACRFLGDIELSIRGDRERAGELFDRALAAARELGDPWSLARTLLVAGWAPYWRSDIEGARAMFEEALAVTRANPEGDPWSEARALGALATVVSETGDEEESLALASQALMIGESTGDRFAVAVAREGVGNSLRRLWRLEEAHPHLDWSVDAFRELGARWELASALTSRGVARRLSGRREEAVKDLREAYRLCRELKERSLITWTASSLAKAQVDSGELDAAHRVLEETASVAGPEGPGSAEWLLDAETVLLLAEGDPEGARSRALELLRLVQARGWPKEVAGQVWWVGRIFGADAVGGEEELASARKVLEETHWEQALREPSPVREG